MGSVGACRQCAVKQFKDESDTKGGIVMACLTPADDGVRISIEDPEAKAFRTGVAEWLMASHPHDCPVCDEGGECHLQDMTVMDGHVTVDTVPEANLSKSGSWSLHQSRDEPLHPMLSLRALLSRLRRRSRPRGVGNAKRGLLRSSRRRQAGERVQREPGGGLSHRRVHGQDLQGSLHPQVGPADRPIGVRALRAWLQYDTGRALRPAAQDTQPLPRGRQRILHL